MIEQTRLKEGELIICCAFNDFSSYNVWYQKFYDIETTLKMIKASLINPDVHVITIRVVRESNKKK
jgi:hypothetical protein